MSTTNWISSCELFVSGIYQMYFYRNLGCPVDFSGPLSVIKQSVVSVTQYGLTVYWLLTEVDDNCQSNRRFFSNNFRGDIDCKHFKIRLRNTSFHAFKFPYTSVWSSGTCFSAILFENIHKSTKNTALATKNIIWIWKVVQHILIWNDIFRKIHLWVFTENICWALNM